MWIFSVVLLFVSYLSSIGYLAKLGFETDTNIYLLTIVAFLSSLVFPMFFPEYTMKWILGYVLYIILGVVLFLHECSKVNTKY